MPTARNGYKFSIFNFQFSIFIMNSIHISTARLILNRPEPVDIRIWTSKGEIQEWRRCICIKYDHYKGTRKFKLLNSNQIRQTRECQIFMLNGMEVFL